DTDPGAGVPRRVRAPRRAARVPRRRSDRLDRDGRALARAGGSALLLGGRGVRPVVPRPARERRPRDAARRVHPRAHGGGGLGRHRGAPLLVPRSRDDPRPGRRARLHARGCLALRHGDGGVGRAGRGLNARERVATPMPTTHTLDCERVHYEWNNALVPGLEIEPGDTVVFDTRDSADGYYRPASSHADVLARGPFRGHPLTGPVRVNGARPGDVLVVEIVEVRPRASFGWTAIRPGRGLLPEAEFAKPFLQIWDLADGTHARMGHGIAVPIEPFPGVMGTAPGPDLFAAAQQAVRYMIDHLVTERGLAREEAYILSSVAVDLKISEIVDTPNWIVSAFLPESVFTQRAR